MMRLTILLLCISLFIFSSCASKPSQQNVRSQTGAQNQSASKAAELTAEDIKIALANENEEIVNTIIEHTGSVRRPGVAVLDIASSNAELGVFATEDIIMMLVKTRRFRVVDRDSIETILKEHQFQYSGVVSDETAVSIGKFIGASIIITGVIRPRQDQFDFSLKILDVETAEIVDFIQIPIGK